MQKKNFKNVDINDAKGIFILGEKNFCIMNPWKCQK